MKYTQVELGLGICSLLCGNSCICRFTGLKPQPSPMQKPVVCIAALDTVLQEGEQRVPTLLVEHLWWIEVSKKSLPSRIHIWFFITALAYKQSKLHFFHCIFKPRRDNRSIRTFAPSRGRKRVVPQTRDGFGRHMQETYVSRNLQRITHACQQWTIYIFEMFCHKWKTMSRYHFELPLGKVCDVGVLFFHSTPG